MINDEFLTANTNIAYPFKDSSQGLASSNEATPSMWTGGSVPRSAFVDFFIHVDSPYESLSLVHVERGNFPNDDVITIIIADQDGTDILQSSFEISQLQEFKAVTLIQELPDIEVAHLVAFTVVSPAIFNLIPINTSILFSVGEVMLEDSVFKVRPARVDSVNADAIINVIDANGYVTLKEGYNVALTVGDTIEDVTSIIMQAAPGLGEGTVPFDGEVQPIYLTSINGVIKGGMSGSTFLKQTSCHRVVSLPATNTLQLHNDCKACCTCEDYSGPIVNMDGRWVSLEAARTILLNTVELFNTHVDLWNDTLLPGIRKVYLSGTAIRGFLADKNKHTVTLNLINQGTTASGRLKINLPPSFTVLKVVVAYNDKENIRACTDMEEPVPPLASEPTINGYLVFVDFAPLCYCTTAQVMLIVQSATELLNLNETVDVEFVDDQEVIAEVSLTWK